MTTTIAPCAEWARLLAPRPEDLSSAEREALDAHLATCAACTAAREDYARMDALIRGLPAPRPLPGLPEKLLALWDVEERAERRAAAFSTSEESTLGSASIPEL